MKHTIKNEIIINLLILFIILLFSLFIYKINFNKKNIYINNSKNYVNNVKPEPTNNWYDYYSDDDAYEPVMDIIVESVESFSEPSIAPYITPEPTLEPTPVPTATPYITPESTLAPTNTPSPTATPEPTPEMINGYSKDELCLLAKVAMAEAEDQGEYGIRLVIDTILNRADSNSITETVYAPEQFTCMTNGRFDVCYVKESIWQLVLEETQCRTNTEVIYFNTHGFVSYGRTLFKYGDHYFSAALNE